MRKKYIQLALLFSLLLTTAVHAQVTIGSAQVPLSGSLVQLKENENLDVNASKGLGMPRVKLSNLKPTTSAQLAQSIGSTGSWDLADHIGLLVFNAKENRCLIEPILEGLYVWEGIEWKYLSEKEKSPEGVYSFTDTRDGEIYFARSFGSQAGEWMLENLRYNPVLHPDPSFTGFTESSAAALSPFTDKYFYYPTGSIYTPSGSEPANWSLIKKSGILYNWAAATNGQNNSNVNQAESVTGTDPTPLTQGICPKGWHLPSDKEWNDLEQEMFENASKYSTYASDLGTWDSAWNTASGYRPASGTQGQNIALKSQCFPYNITTGTPNGKSLSSSQGGFNVLPVGYVNNNTVNSYSSVSYLWSASTYNNSSQSYLRYVSSSVGVRRGQYDRIMLNSVRCKKD